MNDEIFESIPADSSAEDISSVSLPAAEPCMGDPCNAESSCEPMNHPADRTWRCPRCGAILTDAVCPICRYDLSVDYASNQARSAFPPNGYPQYSTPPNPTYGYPAAYASPARSRHWVIWLVCGLIALFFALFVLTASLVGRWILQSDSNIFIPNISGGYSAPYQQDSFPNGASKKELAKIKPGMSYALVTQIFGGEGVLMTEGTDIHGKSYVIYGWPAEHDASAAVYITFTEGCATEITTEGFDQ